MLTRREFTSTLDIRAVDNENDDKEVLMCWNTFKNVGVTTRDETPILR